MAITASRFGSAPLLLDWTGLALEENQRYTEAWEQTIQKLRNRSSGFYDAVIDSELSQVQACLNMAEKIHKKSNITDCIFLGIGGSSLGPMTLLDSLKFKTNRNIDFHFFENPDPIDWNYRIQKLSPENTIVVVVTKSGTTYETVGLFMLAFHWLKESIGQDRAIEQTIAITDPRSGELRSLCQRWNIQNLWIDPSVGGRFSVFTPVGLFAAALAGLNVQEFLLGAKKVRDYCEKSVTDSALRDKNIFCKIAGVFLKHEKTHPIHVLMPYSTQLKLLSNWWVQLWAESLGKNGRGFTPLATVGAIDQHSILQLFRDGPNDKLIGFVQVQDFKSPTPIPPMGTALEMQNEKTFSLLANQDLGALLNIECQSILRVMNNQKRPAYRIQLDTISEESIGALMFYFCVLTAYMGELMNINPFDQPGVEEGKVYIKAALEEQKKALQDSGSDTEVHRLRLHREQLTEDGSIKLFLK